MVIKQIIEDTKDTNLEIIGITVPSIGEMQQMPIEYRKYNNWWWLRSPGDYQYSAASVGGGGGSVYSFGDYVDSERECVRPALKICNLESSNLQIGDRFVFGGKQFVIINENCAFCLEDIGSHCFREDWKAENANDYEKSDLKKYVEEWYQNALKEVIE